MRVWRLLLAVAGSLLAANNLWAGGVPRGTVLELHSCELYAGGCIVSSQATLEGRYMLRAWDFTGGQYGGQDLAGLSLAVLQSGSENLAAQQAVSEQAVVYLPANATAAQRDALLAWTKANLRELQIAAFKTRTVPLQFTRTDQGYSFSAGNAVSLTTVPLESCQTGACGEALWYTPRSATSVFTVAVDGSSRVAEPYLDLKWSDAGQRSVFVGKFGVQKAVQNRFVTTADFCGTAGAVF
jgi:hypothetical protein